MLLGWHSFVTLSTMEPVRVSTWCKGLSYYRQIHTHTHTHTHSAFIKVCWSRPGAVHYVSDRSDLTCQSLFSLKRCYLLLLGWGLRLGSHQANMREAFWSLRVWYRFDIRDCLLWNRACGGLGVTVLFYILTLIKAPNSLFFLEPLRVTGRKFMTFPQTSHVFVLYSHQMKQAAN